MTIVIILKMDGLIRYSFVIEFRKKENRTFVNFLVRILTSYHMIYWINNDCYAYSVLDCSISTDIP